MSAPATRTTPYAATSAVSLGLKTVFPLRDIGSRVPEYTQGENKVEHLEASGELLGRALVRE